MLHVLTHRGSSFRTESSAKDDMNRQLRFENAYNAVAEALLTGRTYTWAALLDIARAELGPRASYWAHDAVNRCICTSTGDIGPGIMAGGSCDGDESTFTFTYIG